MPLTILQGDITKLPVAAIVNAANSRLAPGGGVCGAIFSAAGYEQLEKACRAIGGCETGGAVLTDGFHLPARYVIHAVGPIWKGGSCREAEQLKSCYTTSLELARKHGCRSIAFPVISAGIYGYPKREALEIAIQSIQTFLNKQEMDVFLVVFDRELVKLAEEVNAKKED